MFLLSLTLITSSLLVSCSRIQRDMYEYDDENSFVPFPVESETPKIVFKKSVDGNENVSPSAAIGFMRKFGYLESGPSDSEALYTKDAIEDAIKEVQKFGALPQTGNLDPKTAKLLIAPRCGNKDVETKAEIANSRRRVKRYILGSSGWRKRKLRYHLSNWSPKLGSESLVHRNLQRAFRAWSQYSNLRFVQTSDRRTADIVVSFGRFQHGDRYPFDGPGQVLAHAFYPYDQAESLGGDMHFDDDEEWISKDEKKQTKKGNDDGTDFFTVAVHEMGHALGLSHSPVESSVMFPYYSGANDGDSDSSNSNSDKGFALGQDDILAMYDLYVRKPMEDSPDDAVKAGDVVELDNPRTTATKKPQVSAGAATTTTRRTTVRPTGAAATTTRKPIATTTIRDSRIHVTKSTKLAGSSVDYQDDQNKNKKKNDENVVVTAKTPGFNDLCGAKVDEVANIRGELFAFMGEYLWRFTGRASPDPDYPSKFQQMFAGFPKEVKRIDAVFERSRDSKFVFFSGPKYYVFDGHHHPSPLVSPARPLTDLGLPSNLTKVDAALVWGKNGRAYLFAGGIYWRMSEDMSRVEKETKEEKGVAGSGVYPQEIGKRWRGIPQGLDAAFTWTDGQTYFVKGNKFWRFHDADVISNSPETATTSKYWFGCRE